MPVIVSDDLHRKIVGTAHWCGTVDGVPVILLGYYGGACLWGFRNMRWEIVQKFLHLSDAYDKLGIRQL